MQDPDIIETNGEHNHNPNDDLTKRDNKRKLKEVSVNVGFITRKCVQEVTKGKNLEELECLPKESSMKKMVQRAKKNKDVPKCPQGRTGFLIEGKYSEYCEKPFLRYDSGIDDPDRILIFTTDEGVKDLEDYSHWAADGTFRSCPLIFYQLYLIHVHINAIQTVPR